MTGFEYLFAFYALLMGLALANVATGFADVWRGHEGVRFGICTPMLALAVMAFILGQWSIAWVFRGRLEMTPMELVWTLVATLPYVFISHAMFPKHSERWKSLDDYYLDHRAVLLGILMFAPAIAIVSNAIAYRDFGTDPIIRVIMTVLVPATVLRFRNRWAHAGALLIVSAYSILARLFQVW